MWRFKQFIPKESAGLENRTIDIGNIKVHVREIIAEGGFSCVYIARDLVNPTKQYALKHVIIQDKESMDLVTKEISVMKSLEGHPNVVTLVGQAILDMGKTREALILMEFCEKSLVSVLESRGAGYFEEKKVALIFRDICNAVFAMHCQSPPIAHRDLKAENVLLGSDGAWKLCDFGSVSTNHKIFEKPEEMGIEEDNIRKHTTPAYRAPEMWDLYRREVISEKVDIWALGCLLYRICYLKSAFDGESKLQILNGNYKIPDLPKYSASLTNLIKDVLTASPDTRPDITQVWFRVNELLPMELQKDLPDGSPNASIFHDDVPKKSTSSLRGSSPQPAQQNPRLSVPHQHATSANPAGSFWSTQYAQGSSVSDKVLANQNQPVQNLPKKSPIRGFTESSNGGDFEIRFSPDGSEYGFSGIDVNKRNSKPVNTDQEELEKELEKELSKLTEELRVVNSQKEEISAKYEKLCAICSSQRREIEELKRSLAVGPTSQSKPGSNPGISPASSVKLDTPPKKKIDGTLEEFQKGLLTTPSPDTKQTWSAFSDEPRAQTIAKSSTNTNTTTTHPRSVRTVRSSSSNGNNRSNSTGGSTTSRNSSVSDAWTFDQDGFKAFPSGLDGSKSSDFGNNFGSFSSGNNSGVKKQDLYQPAGWTGF